MPHQCTNCARRFDDGSKEMLSGCPDCGGTKFQFLPADGSAADDDGSTANGDGSGPPGKTGSGLQRGAESGAPEPPEPPGPDGSTVAERVGRATAKLRDVVADGPRSSGDGPRSSNGGGPESDPGSSDGPRSGAASRRSRSGARSGRSSPGAEPRSNADARPDADPRRDGEPGADPGSETGPAGPAADESSEVVASDDPGIEDGAQSSARSEMVSAEELPDGPLGVGGGAAGGGLGGLGGATGSGVGARDRPADERNGPAGEREARVVEAPSGETPDLAELREELNDQFEGIRISEPGQYELNLMELYEREETIIALQENGRYVIEPPESWRGD